MSVITAETPSQTWEYGAAQFTIRWGRSGGVVTASGEIDAANSDRFAELLADCASRCEWLVLNLGELEFMGTAAVSALQRIDAECARGKISLALVPGAAASRLLRVCDPDTDLPLSESVTTALAMVQKSHQRLHQTA